MSFIDYAFVVEFESFLRKGTPINKTRPLTNNGIMKDMERFKKLVGTAFKFGCIPQNPFNLYRMKFEEYESDFLENQGDGRFAVKALPKDCQMGPIEGIIVDDFDGDGALDALLTGNAYTTEVSTGRYDAIKGIVLKGSGNGQFSTLAQEKSGFLNDWDTSGLSKLAKADGNLYVLSANNDGPLKIYELNQQEGQYKKIDVPADIVSAEIVLNDGSSYKREFYHGEGYLSQQSRSIFLNGNIKAIHFKDNNGNTKTVYDGDSSL